MYPSFWRAVVFKLWFVKATNVHERGTPIHELGPDGEVVSTLKTIHSFFNAPTKDAAEEQMRRYLTSEGFDFGNVVAAFG